MIGENVFVMRDSPWPNETSLFHYLSTNIVAQWLSNCGAIYCHKAAGNYRDAEAGASTAYNYMAADAAGANEEAGGCWCWAYDVRL